MIWRIARRKHNVVLVFWQTSKSIERNARFGSRSR